MPRLPWHCTGATSGQRLPPVSLNIRLRTSRHRHSRFGQDFTGDRALKVKTRGDIM
jgi:hypothetical protein